MNEKCYWSSTQYYESGRTLGIQGVVIICFPSDIFFSVLNRAAESKVIGMKICTMMFLQNTMRY